MVNSTEVCILHGFEFHSSCNTLEVTQDQETVIGTGSYKPCMAVFDLLGHTQKFERNTDEETIKIAALGQDWKKLALLHKTGKLEFHTQFGKYYTVDLPQECRDMKADLVRGEVLASGKEASIFRFTTVEGKFLAPIATKVSDIEGIALNTTHSLYGACGKGGEFEFIDARSQTSIRTSSLGSAAATSCTFSEDGLLFGVGTHEGLSALYDLRSPKPLLEKDQNNDFPIKKIQIQKKTVITTDKKAVKVWSRQTGKTLASAEPGFQINASATSEGILFIGGDSPDMKTYYVPELGGIPKWCSYLEHSTEEMFEAKKETYFNHYRFLTQEDLYALNLQKEIGKEVKPHMHGYLVPKDLFEKCSAPKASYSAPTRFI
ncbi:ribosome biogenesis protein ENP2 [Nematocida displodere]|uniref:Ribosome biogenesis protein ENP2 n=1 Tax=Nematocida displodere TaxID=1805483 RepID=A0A177EDF3_9MICR|nr:ribosome biogenesis protein ENP2 [Nematocida displodere]